MQLTLSSKKFHIHYHDGEESWYSRLRRRANEDFLFYMCWINMANQHNYKTYLKQLEAQQTELSLLTLDELYERHGIFHS